MKPKVTFEGAFPHFFPESDGRSMWMYRLAIIRDDLNHEISQMGVDKETRGTVWRAVYSQRRATITFCEAADVFDGFVGFEIKSNRLKFSAFVLDELSARCEAIGIADKKLRSVRNALGGHVKPQDAQRELREAGILKKGETLLGKAVTNLSEHGGEVEIDLNTGYETNYQVLSSVALLFIWPNVTGDDRKTSVDRYFDLLLPACNHVIRAADLLLHQFWTDLGIEPKRFELATLPFDEPEH